MKKLAALLLVFLFACGGGGGGGSSTPVVPSSYVGTWHLTAFTVTYANGTVITQSSPLITSYSGTMTITSSGNASQSVSVNGISGTVSATIESINGNTCNFVSTKNGCTGTVTGILNGTTLTTNFALGTCGANYSEIDVWTKVSSKPTLEDADARMSNVASDTPIGGLASMLMESLAQQ